MLIEVRHEAKQSKPIRIKEKKVKNRRLKKNSTCSHLNQLFCGPKSASTTLPFFPLTENSASNAI